MNRVEYLNGVMKAFLLLLLLVSTAGAEERVVVRDNGITYTLGRAYIPQRREPCSTGLCSISPLVRSWQRGQTLSPIAPQPRYQRRGFSGSSRYGR